jgi:hypothetical protein
MLGFLLLIRHGTMMFFLESGMIVYAMTRSYDAYEKYAYLAFFQLSSATAGTSALILSRGVGCEQADSAQTGLTSS